ncbi:MAG TPA: AzlC family ABC transporter permease [Candidatus Nanopelagicales bacterium]|nr:AzlC family ABC transporter permease [Candidatus Nanopelagicales bacterium]
MGAATWEQERRSVMAAALGVGLATGAYGISFGAIAVTGGLSVLQTQVLSVLMFTGGSQFALVGVLAGGGGPVSAIATSVLLGARNAFYGLRLAPVLQVRGPARLAAAQLTIDESTAMSFGRDERTFGGRSARLAFWATGLSVFVCWNLATAVGALAAAAIGDPRTFGLDAAIPAGFLALVWPRLRDRRAVTIAAAAGVVALVLTPVLRPGVPVLVSSVVAVVAGVLAVRRRTAAAR